MPIAQLPFRQRLNEELHGSCRNIVDSQECSGNVPKLLSKQTCPAARRWQIAYKRRWRTNNNNNKAGRIRRRSCQSCKTILWPTCCVCTASLLDLAILLQMTFAFCVQRLNGDIWPYDVEKGPIGYLDRGIRWRRGRPPMAIRWPSSLLMGMLNQCWISANWHIVSDQEHSTGRCSNTCFRTGACWLLKWMSYEFES